MAIGQLVDWSVAGTHKQPERAMSYVFVVCCVLGNCSIIGQQTKTETEPAAGAAVADRMWHKAIALIEERNRLTNSCSMANMANCRTLNNCR